MNNSNRSQQRTKSIRISIIKNSETRYDLDWIETLNYEGEKTEEKNSMEPKLKLKSKYNIIFKDRKQINTKKFQAPPPTDSASRERNKSKQCSLYTSSSLPATPDR